MMAESTTCCCRSRSRSRSCLSSPSSSSILALVPLRDGTPITTSCFEKSAFNTTTIKQTTTTTRKRARRQTTRLFLPYIPLLLSSSSSSSSSNNNSGGPRTTKNVVVIGREQLLQCMWAACACSDNLDRPRATIEKCTDCLCRTDWVKRFVSRALLRISSSTSIQQQQEAECCHYDEDGDDDCCCSLTLQIIGTPSPSTAASNSQQHCHNNNKSTLQRIRLNGKPLSETNMMKCDNGKEDVTKNEDKSGPCSCWKLQIGDILTLDPPPPPAATTELSVRSTTCSASFSSSLSLLAAVAVGRDDLHMQQQQQQQQQTWKPLEFQLVRLPSEDDPNPDHKPPCYLVKNQENPQQQTGKAMTSMLQRDEVLNEEGLSNYNTINVMPAIDDQLKQASEEQENGQTATTTTTTTTGSNTRNQRKRPRPDNNDDQQPLPLGTFSGTTVYQNRLHAGETFANGHVAVSNLLLPNCTAALVTTFEHPGLAWLEHVFDTVPELTVIAHDRRLEEIPREIGNAEILPMTKPAAEQTPRRPPRPQWYWIAVQPHTGGCLHGKLLLCRSQEGLRVVVSGNNFYQGQWETERDCLWIQDFFPDGSRLVQCNNNRHVMGDNGHLVFGNRLRSFLDDITCCKDEADQRLVQSRLDVLLEGVNLATTQARLVVSFPRKQKSGADRGGWQQLADAVRESRRALVADSDCDSDSENNDRFNQASDEEDSTHVYAMSGSFGDLEPDFVLQMRNAMRGVDDMVPKQTLWTQIKNVHCLWPSRSTALEMNPVSLIKSMRAISYKHWQTIPEETKRRIFTDARPNPEEKAFPNIGEGCHCVSHCKVLYAENRAMGVLYVGSHNFSKAAWGLRSSMPKNVEVGVVLATTTPSMWQEWRRRLPYVLPDANSLSDPNYAPASAGNRCRDALMEGRTEEAIQMLHETLLGKDEDDQATDSQS